MLKFIITNVLQAVLEKILMYKVTLFITITYFTNSTIMKYAIMTTDRVIEFTE